jgi:hypothetical protein
MFLRVGRAGPATYLQAPFDRDLLTVLLRRTEGPRSGSNLGPLTAESSYWTAVNPVGPGASGGAYLERQVDVIIGEVIFRGAGYSRQVAPVVPAPFAESFLAQKLDLLDRHVQAAAGLPGLGLVLARAQTAFQVDLLAFGQVLVASLGQFPPGPSN